MCQLCDAHKAVLNLVELPLMKQILPVIKGIDPSKDTHPIVHAIAVSLNSISGGAKKDLEAKATEIYHNTPIDMLVESVAVRSLNAAMDSHVQTIEKVATAGGHAALIGFIEGRIQELESAGSVPAAEDPLAGVSFREHPDPFHPEIVAEKPAPPQPPMPEKV